MATKSQQDIGVDVKGVQPVKITDPDFMDKMVQMEGAHWLAEVERRYNDPCFPPRFLKAFEEQRSGFASDDDGFVFVEGNPAIYGDYGWNRYYVRGFSGEVYFSRHHGHKSIVDGEPAVEKAARLGFKIWG